ncbi:sigma-70 family RNA polymerase sigma factor [Streptomyces tendae]|uniref:hypothetical protein n=1 Tax=Streptomyces tendae TaxID=1932 RepID=UPI00369A13E9
MRVICDELAGPLHAYVPRLLQGGGSLRPWLFRVARNLVVDDYRRRAARRREADPAWSFGAVPTQSDDIDRMLDSVLPLQLLQRAGRPPGRAAHERADAALTK